MKKYPCPVTKAPDIYPRCTAIIGEASDKSFVFKQWASGLTVLWIKENAYWDDGFHISIDQLNTAGYHHVNELKRLADIGTDVHRMIKNYIKKKGKYNPRPKSPEAETAYNSFLNFNKDYHIEYNATELRVYGDRWAGTLDIDCFLDGVATIIDVKTSDNLYPETRYQTAAYREARTVQLYDMGAYYCPGANGALRLDRQSGEYEYKNYSKTYKQDLKVFNAMVELYYLRHPRIRAKFLKNKEEI